MARIDYRWVEKTVASELCNITFTNFGTLKLSSGVKKLGVCAWMKTHLWVFLTKMVLE